MIPQEKSEAVTRSLREAFGVTEFEDIRVVTGGHTPSLVCRIIVRGRPYLLKIISRGAWPTEDPTRHFTCMRAAAEAGLAPHVWYTGIEDRIFISDFVEAVPFPRTEALVRIPALLRSLHALLPFPGVPNHINTSCMFLMNEGPALDGFLRSFQEAKILPKAETGELLARRAQLAAAYSRLDPQIVSSHNDLFKPDNFLFDGGRVLLVDWEAAFLNDRYADLVVAANLVVTNEAEETAFLQEYFGQPPTAYQRARFFLLQQVAHIFYAMAYLWPSRAWGGSTLEASAKPVDLGDKPPDAREFQRRIWAGEVDLADKPTKIEYGRVHLEQLFQNTAQARFGESLRIVSDCEAIP